MFSTFKLVPVLVCLPLFLNTSFTMMNNPQQEKLGLREIVLPDPEFSSQVSVEEALLNRRSVREYSAEQLTMQEISQVLWAAYGITDKQSYPSFLLGGLRTAPSAGALYPLEIYLIAGNIMGLKPGVYKYESNGHLLIPFQDGDIRADLAEAALDQAFLKEAPAIIFYSAVFKRTTQKYGDRGHERYVCMDVGHSAQNVYLQAYTLGIGTCAVGAFSDKMVSNVLMIPDDEEPLYLMPFGKIK